MSQSSSSDPNSLESDGRSKDHVEKLKEQAYEKADDFGSKLDTVVRQYTRDSRTTKSEIKAIIRCLNTCIETLNQEWKEFSRGQVLEEVRVRPVANASEELSGAQLRSNARKILKYLKSTTLELFVAAFYTHASTGDEDAKRAIQVMQDAITDCEALIDRVMDDGYDCKTTSEEEDDCKTTSEEEDDCKTTSDEEDD